MVLMECLVHLVPSDKQVHKVFKVYKDCKVLQVLPVQLAHKDLPVLLVLQELVVVEHWVTPAEQLD
jgi:hypothetical protein